MVYDTARHVVVLFGGTVTSTPTFSGETWEWDGGTWTLRASAGPAPQAYHAMAYDESRHVTVLYGASGLAGQTWEWDGNSWTDRTANAPGYRIRHSLFYDRSRGRSVLFGGRNQTSDLSDTWEWDGAAWMQRNVSGPSARSEHQMVYDTSAAKGFLVAGSLFYCSSPEGCTKPKYDDSWTLDSTGWAKLSPLLSPRRYSHSMAYDEARVRAVVFSGNTSVVSPDGIIADTLEFVGGAWAQPDSAGPRARYSHTMTYDSANARTLMFGGSGAGIYRDTWAWDGHQWSLLASTGSDPLVSTLAYDSDRAVPILFDGGRNNFNGLSATYEWNGSAWVLRATGGPPQRGSQVMYYDPVRHATVLVGGRNNQNAPLTDMWQWDGAAWLLISANIPPFGGTDPGGFFRAAFDEGRAIPVLRESYNISGTWRSATWEWNGTVWVQRLLESSSNPYTSFVLFDSTRHVIVRDAYTYPNFEPVYEGTVLEWDGTTWTTRPGSSRAPRTQGGFAYDRARDRIVAFSEIYVASDWPTIGTWEYGPLAPSVEVQPQGATVGPGTRVVLSVGVAGGGPLAYQWRKDFNPIPGAIGTAYVIPSAGPTDGGDYDVVVSNSCGNDTSAVAPVRLICPSDFNDDGFVNGDDADAFNEAFASGDLSADFNHDGLVDSADYDAFMAAFDAGC